MLVCPLDWASVCLAPVELWDVAPLQAALVGSPDGFRVTVTVL